MKSIMMWHTEEPKVWFEDGSEMGITQLLNKLFDAMDEFALAQDEIATMLMEHGHDPRGGIEIPAKDVCPHCGSTDVEGEPLPRPAHAPVDVSDFVESQEGHENRILRDEETDHLASIYDPLDDTFATGRECPNCGEGRIHGHQGHAAISEEGDPSGGKHWHCTDCGHIWAVPDGVL